MPAIRHFARRWFLAACAVALVAGAGCSTSPPTPTTGTTVVDSTPKPASPGRARTSAGQVRQLLGDRAARLLGGDVEGYLASVAPSARAFEERIARSATAVPLSSVEMVFNAPGQRDDARAFRGASVTFLFTYQRVPAGNRFSFKLVADFEKVAGQWVITRSEPETETDLPYWLTGPVAVSVSPHFLAMSRPGVPGVDRVVSIAEESRSRLGSLVTVEPDPVHVMILVASGEELAQLHGLSAGGQSGALVAFSEYSSTGTAEPVGRQMSVNVQAVVAGQTAVGEDRREVTAVQILQHELGHLALTRYASPARPDWVVEGAAMYLAEERREATWRDGAFRARIAGLDFSQVEAAQDLPAELYAYVNATVLVLVERYGVSAFWDFYRAFGELGGAAPSADATQSLLHRFFGLDLAGVGSATNQWLDARGR